jgi:hypothetical protein
MAVIIILNLIIVVLAFFILLRIFLSGLFTGNEYKKINGVLHVKHPGGDWMPLEDHQEKHHKKRSDFR